MANSKGKTNPSAAKLHNPNQTPNAGNDVDYSREHIRCVRDGKLVRGSQDAMSFNKPALSKKGK
jgi:hypothetical protein